jgi:hypothetical protein
MTTEEVAVIFGSMPFAGLAGIEPVSADSSQVRHDCLGGRTGG